MTQRERAQVVELLRCAADRHWGIFEAAEALGHPTWQAGPRYLESGVHMLAVRAAQSVSLANPFVDYDTRSLEAALRVEQGEWP